MAPLVEIYRTPLGCTVVRRIDNDGEHITLEVRPHGAPLPEIELAPQTTGLTPYERYNA